MIIYEILSLIESFVFAVKFKCYCSLFIILLLVHISKSFYNFIYSIRCGVVGFYSVFCFIDLPLEARVSHSDGSSVLFGSMLGIIDGSP